MLQDSRWKGGTSMREVFILGTNRAQKVYQRPISSSESSNMQLQEPGTSYYSVAVLLPFQARLGDLFST